MMALQICHCISIFKTNISYDSPAKSVSNHIGPPNVAYFIQRYYYLLAVQHAVFFLISPCNLTNIGYEIFPAFF